MTINKLYYENILKQRNVLYHITGTEETSYYMASVVDNFIKLTLYPNSDREVKGWKLHISIDDTNVTHLEKAWDVTVGILVKHKIVKSKLATYFDRVNNIHIPLHKRKGQRLCMNPIAADETTTSTSEPTTTLSTEVGSDPAILIENGLEAGKQITIYASAENRDDWHSILQEITTALINANIQPSCLPYGNNRLKNNPYISYRNDCRPGAGDTVEYQENIGHANPYNYEDIFQVMRDFDLGDYENEVPTWEAVVGESIPDAIDLAQYRNYLANKPSESNTMPQDFFRVNLFSQNSASNPPVNEENSDSDSSYTSNSSESSTESDRASEYSSSSGDSESDNSGYSSSHYFSSNK